MLGFFLEFELFGLVKELMLWGSPLKGTCYPKTHYSMWPDSIPRSINERASHDRHVVLENSEGESEITANSLPFLRGFCWALKPRTEMSEMSNTEEREDTACIEITCSVKGYQECNFTVDVWEEFNKSWQWLYSSCFTQFEASRDNCIGLVRLCSTLFDYIGSIGSKVELTAK